MPNCSQTREPNGVLDVGQIDRDGGQAVRPAHRHRPPLNIGAVDRRQRRRVGAHVVVGRQRRFGVAVVDGGERGAVDADAAHVELRRRPAGVRALVGRRRLPPRSLCPAAGRLEQRLVDRG